MTHVDENTIGAGASDASAQSTALPAETTPRFVRFKSASYRVLSRAAYWSPVLVALVLFGQVSFRGLRPSMAEARRLASAEVSLDERHDRAVAENRETAAHLAARQDPVFRERQRRLRVIEPPLPTTTIPEPSARTDDGS